jgi:hypothetical protein
MVSGLGVEDEKPTKEREYNRGEKFAGMGGYHSSSGDDGSGVDSSCA